MTSFQQVGIGYRDGNNFYLKFTVDTGIKNPIVVSASALKMLAENKCVSSDDVIIYEREPQKRLDLNGLTFEEGWSVKRIGKIIPAKSEKSLKITIRKLPDYYITRRGVIDAIIMAGKSVNVVQKIEEDKMGMSS
jgi:hypothetical protein